jgi:uncharacterized protein
MTAADTQSLKELLAVQDCDRIIHGLRHQRVTLPERQRLRDLDAERIQLSEQRVVAQDQRHELDRTQKRLEDEVALLDERIDRETAKLYGGDAGGVKELQALQDELAGLGKRKTLVEDQVLEVMEECEPVDAELTRLGEAETSVDDSEAAAREALATSEAEIDAALEAAEGDRAARAAGVPGEVLANYETLRSVPGQIGVARLVGSTCHGCHLELAAVEIDRLKKLPDDELVHCEECGCILVR